MSVDKVSDGGDGRKARSGDCEQRNANGACPAVRHRPALLCHPHHIKLKQTERFSLSSHSSKLFYSKIHGFSDQKEPGLKVWSLAQFK